MQMVKKWFNGYYSKQNVWTLFLVSGFPLHVWALILFFWDFSWIAERSGTWDAISVGAYALVIAFVESLFVLLVSLVLGFLISKVWSSKTRTSTMSLIILLISIWAIVGQLYYIRTPNLEWLVWTLASQSRPLFLLYLGLGGIVSISVVIPIWFALSSEKFCRVLDALIERVSLLMMLYLVLDLISIVAVAWRNNFWLPN
jgi:hypothetical protein